MTPLEEGEIGPGIWQSGAGEASLVAIISYQNRSDQIRSNQTSLTASSGWRECSNLCMGNTACGISAAEQSSSGREHVGCSTPCLADEHISLRLHYGLQYKCSDLISLCYRPGHLR